MLINTDQHANNIVASSGVAATNVFKVADTGHLFSILSSKLYSDKIAAVIREVACNAMDAHIAVGAENKPIQVKLPTVLDKSFYIKDWGSGLSDDEVMSLYTTYGWSNKQTSNTQTGGFGLGSKSPFAYTNENGNASAFSITSAFKGVKRIYSCYLDATGKPAISRLFEAPSEADWQNGVMVSFPIQEKDIAEFKQKAVEILSWFKVLPEVLGLDKPLEKPSFKINSSFFKISPDSHFSTSSSSHVVMANVRYPIDYRKMEKDLSWIEKSVLNSGIHLFLENGEVTMTPSREHLEYNEKTKQSIQKYLAKASEEIADLIAAKVSTKRPKNWVYFQDLITFVSELPYSLKSDLSKFLKMRGFLDEEIIKIKAIIDSGVFVLPGWVGGSNILSEETSPYSPVLLNGPYSKCVASCRVFQYSLKHDGKVRKQEIIGGKYKSSGYSQPSAVLNFNVKTAIFYADSSLADAKVKSLISKHATGYESILLVMPVWQSENPYSITKQYAEKLSKIVEIQGLPILGTSILASPPQKVKPVRLKVSKTASLLDIFGNEGITLVSNGRSETTKIKEITDENSKFYVICKDLSSPNSSVYNLKENGGTIEFSARKFPNVSAIISKIQFEFGDVPKNYVVAKSEAQVKKLKLVELGFKPYLVELKNLLGPKIEAFTKDKIFIPTEDYSDTSRSSRRDYAWQGLFGKQMFNNTEFFKKFSESIDHQEFWDNIKRFVLNTNSTPELELQLELVNHLSNLNSWLGYALCASTSVGSRNPWDIQEEFLTQYPQFRFLNFEAVSKSIEKGENIEQILAMLKAALVPCNQNQGIQLEC